MAIGNLQILSFRTNFESKIKGELCSLCTELKMFKMAKIVAEYL